jgi:DNA polymerase elongation subunit (family B)
MIVHNTDSVFFTFNFEDPETGEPIRGRRALELTIELAIESAHLCSLFLPPPMKLAYEKTLMSFILLSKKRYVGMLYETDPNKGKLKFMGLPLKRRDSCDYVKDVYGGILTILMKEPDNIEKAIEFLNTSLRNLINGNVSMEKLALTKALRSDYKNPGQIAHKVLAERIGERDPGNKPKGGDRIKFVFINTGDKKSLLGERIETPEFIVQNKLQIDYTYYITNQLMNPLQQMFGLALEKIFTYKKKKQADFVDYRKTVDRLWDESNDDVEVFMKKREKYCSGHVKQLLFEPFLTEVYNKQNGVRTMFQFYTKKK